MGNFSRWWVIFLLFTPLEKAWASHAMGTDIAYECLGNNDYKIIVSFYRDCYGITAPGSIPINYFSLICDTSITEYLQLDTSQTEEVSPLCAALLSRSRCRSSSGDLPGVERYVYIDTINLPYGCPDWIVGYSECCRNSDITNLSSPASYNLYAYAQINNTNNLCNNSPIFTTLPVPYVCAGNPFFYNHGAIDIDGDSLFYRMIQPSTSYQVVIPYMQNIHSFNVNYPLSTVSGAFDFDSTTGQMTFAPDQPQQAVVTIQVEEYRNGVMVGSTMRDIQVVVLESIYCTNTPPVVPNSIANISGGGVIDSNTIQMCPGSQLSFELVVADTEGDSVILSSNASSAIPGSNFTVNGSGSTVRGQFTWVPTAADSGYHPFQVTYSDNGCPLSTPQTVTYVIRVFNRVTAGLDLVYCGDSLRLNAIGGSFFTWWPTTGLSRSDIANPKAAPSDATMYYVTSDCGSDSVFIDVKSSYSVTAGNDTVICLNALAQLNATVSTSAYAPYTFSWFPTVGVDFPSSQSTPAKPLIPTTYYLTAVSAEGCVKHDTMQVGISGIAPSVTALIDPEKVCVGESARLSVHVRPSSCVVTSTPCTGTPVDYAVGSASQQTSNSVRGTPYKGSYEDGKVQYLYSASELNAMGIMGGSITKVAFHVALKRSGNNPYNNFTIKMGCTDFDQIPRIFVPGLSTVYGPTAYTTTTGWNMHNLTSHYDWDGASNLIIQICFDNGTAMTSGDDEVFYTPTSFASVTSKYDGLTSGCSLASGDTVRNRPNTRLTVCSRLQGSTTIDWTVRSGNATISDPTIYSPAVQVFGTSAFRAEVSMGGCPGQDEIIIEVDTTFTVQAAPDTSLCRPAPIQLNAGTTGQPSPIYLTCGVNGTPAGTSSIYQIGASPGLSTNPSPFKASSHDVRLQMLFRSYDLDTASVSRGIFTSIAFDVKYKSSLQPFKSFSIKIGCTHLDALGNNFISNLQEVFIPKNITTVVGWNVFNFDNYYDWDGSSNIVVEVCFDNSSPSPDDIITYTPTSFTSVIDSSGDYFVGCLPTPKIGGSFFRPNVQFGVSPPPISTFSYSWSPAGAVSPPNSQTPVANPAATTDYVVTVTDGICIATDTVSVDFYSTFDVNVFGTNVGCNGAFDGNAASVPNGGVSPYDFEWSTGRIVAGVSTDTLYDLYEGTYHVTVVDNNGCDATDSVTITVPPPLVVDSIATINVNCFGGNSGTAHAWGDGGTPPYAYSWSSGSDSAYASSLSAGTYELTIIDASGCATDSSATISEPAPIFSSMIETNASCYKYSDGSATVSASGGTPPYLYNWNVGQNGSTATGLRAGSYVVSVTDDSNCLHLDTAFINQPDSFSIIVNTLSVSCFGDSDGSANASVAGDTVNYIFTWNTTPATTGPHVSGLPAGPISFSVIDTAGCIINSAAIVGSPAEILLSASSDDITCYGYDDGGASITVVSGGIPPFHYLWSDSQNTSGVSGLNPGTYYFTVIDANNCEKSDSVTINEPDSIVIRDSVFDASCFGEDDGRIFPIITGGTPSFSYLWSDGQATPIAENLLSGDYSITITDLNGCVDSLLGIFVDQPSPIVISDFEISPPCQGELTGVITFSASGGTSPYSFILDGSDVETSPEFVGVGEGGHFVEVMDANGCITDTPVAVNPHAPIQLGFDSAEIKINVGQEVTLNPIIELQDSVVRYSWLPPDGLSCFDCPNPVASPFMLTPYQLTVFDRHNCEYTEKIVVNVANNLILMVPNAFTPDGDGINDILYVYGLSVAAVKFRVFDRWGEKLFESRSMNDGWDGKFKGKAQPSGVYVYYVEAVFEDRQEKHIKGATTILK